MDHQPTISIVIPTHDIPEREFFVQRALDSIYSQSFQDYEIIITKTGKGMAHNTNSGIKKATGKLIKILFMDDFLAHKDALKDIVTNFAKEDRWLVTGCIHLQGKVLVRPHVPRYSVNMHKGENTIGSPSVLTIKNDDPFLFDENMTWLLDCDYYKRMYERYGLPKVVRDTGVVIGLGPHQVTNTLSLEQKIKEHRYMDKKYA